VELLMVLVVTEQEVLEEEEVHPLVVEVVEVV